MNYKLQFSNEAQNACQNELEAVIFKLAEQLEGIEVLAIVSRVLGIVMACQEADVTDEVIVRTAEANIALGFQHGLLGIGQAKPEPPTS